jgi:hypothetical protein
VSAAASQNAQVNGLGAQYCAQERAAIGKKAFHKKYGGKHTMRSCVRRNQKFVLSAIRVANQDCQDELAMTGSADFIDEYGDDDTTPLADAVTECVAEDVDQILNPQDYVDDGTDS